MAHGSNHALEVTAPLLSFDVKVTRFNGHVQRARMVRASSNHNVSQKISPLREKKKKKKRKR